ncbi:MAG TPA: ankyrin repeat domain-containing protein [Pyrinomonadaceae bacterium]|jgi:ankyrin repeat protein
MASTFSHSIVGAKSPQYAYALVILSGGIAFIISQGGELIAAWLLYALLAALFASIWPDRALQWAGWLCLPILLLICFDVLVTGSFYGVGRNGTILIKALPSACLGVYVGSRLSVRKVANHLATERVNRRRAPAFGKGAQTSLVLKDRATPGASVKAISSGHGSKLPAKVTKPVTPALSLNATLIKAAQDGDLERIKLLVAQGADVNALSRDEWTPLMIASLGGDVEMVKTLFGNGAALHDAGGKGWTALMIATIEGQTDVVRALLEHGAEVSAKNNAGWTALRFAVSMDETEILRVLLDAGADVNVADKEGKTALMQAAGENIRESLKVLLDAGADPHLKDHKEQTALMIARQCGHTEIIKLLKEAQAKASAGIDASANILSDDNSYFYLLKEELEDGLNSYSGSPTQADDIVSRVLSAIQIVQGHIDATSKERILSPSEISHKLVFTLKEAATLSGLPRQHLLEAIEGRRLKAQLIKHAWRIKRAELADYIRRLS